MNIKQNNKWRIQFWVLLFLGLLGGYGLTALPVVAAPFAYVANQGGGAVLVIDTATNSIVGEPIIVGQHPFNVAITPNGLYAYVTVYYGGSVAVINTTTNTILSTILVEGKPYGVAITPDGRFAYVTVINDSGPGKVTVIDTATNSIVGEPIIVGMVPWGLAFTPDGNYAYVANYSGNTVTVIDTATRSTVGEPLKDMGLPRQIAITPDGKYAYVSMTVGGVKMIDTATNKVESTISVGGAYAGYSEGIAITPDGKFAYVASKYAISQFDPISYNAVAVIDLASNTLVGEPIQFGDKPTYANIAIGPDGLYAYVTNATSNSDSVFVIDLTTNKVLENPILLPTGYAPWGIVITPLNYFITMAANPMNAGTVACDPNPVKHGSSTNCTALANPGYTFTHWSGDCSGTTCTLSNVMSAKSVTANFDLAGPALSINNVAKNEGNKGATNFTFTVTLSPASTQKVTVQYETADGTATAGYDYTSTSGTLTFKAGQTSKAVTVKVFGDKEKEPDENFIVNLTNYPIGASIRIGQGIGTILNDDGL